MLGNYNDIRPPFQHNCNERPNVLFTCRVHKSSEIVVEDDSHELTHPGWSYYLDAEKKITNRGYPYLRTPLISERWAMSVYTSGKTLEEDDVEQWRKSGEEADRIMAQVLQEEVEEDDLASLFGSSE
jgi:hypothetical protein